ncbi:MAG: hypothetical protein IPG50_03205 [Myxococcales bacterium]|nr:hypothetical protein [Myxococcales bacterium]
MNPAAGSLPRLRRRWPALVLVLAGLAAFHFFGPKLPRDQTVRVQLGPEAAALRELALRYNERSPLTGEPLREVSYRYPAAEAPRTIRHTLRIPDGEYLLEIELVTHQGRTTLSRPVRLSGADTTVDVSTAVRELALTPDGGAR